MIPPMSSEGIMDKTRREGIVDQDKRDDKPLA